MIIDGTTVAAFFAGLAALVPVLIKGWLDVRHVHNDYKFVWAGIVDRGYVEAVKQGALLGGCQNWIVSQTANETYREIANELRHIYAYQKIDLKREPTDAEIAWAIEQRFQQWMITHACPRLGVNQHGCLAIASVIARSGDNELRTSGEEAASKGIHYAVPTVDEKE